MSIFLWIISATFAMSLVTWTGLLVLFLREKSCKKSALHFASFLLGFGLIIIVRAAFHL